MADSMMMTESFVMLEDIGFASCGLGRLLLLLK